MFLRTETDVIIGKEIKNQDNFFVKPFQSIHLQIFQSNGFLDAEKKYDVSEISSKLFYFKFEDLAVFLPLL